MQQVSIGQACANALARWLQTTLSPDVTVFERWPDPNTKLPAKSVSVLRVGRRARMPAWQLDVAAVQVIGNGPEAQIAYQLGGIEQAMQIDVWATSDAERDDILAQLDVVLYAGIDQTLGLPGDPIRDGILLPLLDGFDGNNCDYWFDEPEIDDTPGAMQRSEFRATFFGEARTGLIVFAREPSALIKQVTPDLVGGTAPVQG